MKNGLLVFGGLFMLVLSMGFALADNHTINGTNNTSNMTNDTGTDNDTDMSAQIFVKEGWPQGMAYTFVCDDFSGFEPNTFTWNFGDGETLTGPNEVYHEYDAAGTYTVNCLAADADQSVTAERTVTVTGDSVDDTNQTTNQTNQTGDSVNLYVKEWYPKNNHYVFVCEPQGFTPNSFSWWYGDGEKLLNIHNGDTYHIYDAPGTYEVTCQGNGDNVFPQDKMTVTVTELGLPAESAGDDDTRDARDNTADMCGVDATIYVNEINGQDVQLTCDEFTGFVPVAYVWDFGDGVTETSHADVHHRYDTPGTYTVHCAATDGKTVAFGQKTLTVGAAQDGADNTGDDTGDDNSASLSVAQVNGQYVATCTAEGFSADVYDFAVTDLATGEQIESANDVADNSFEFTAAAGDYAVYCAATGEGVTESETTTVNVVVGGDNTGDDTGNDTGNNTGNDTTADVTIVADIEPIVDATTGITGTATATLVGSTLNIEVVLNGIEADELAPGAPVLLVRAPGDTIQFALEAGASGDGTAEFSLETQLSEEEIAGLLAGEYTIIVHTTTLEGALRADLEV